MAQINIITTAEEQQKVLEALKTMEGTIAPVSKIAKVAGLNPNRVRFVIVDLEAQDRIERIAAKAFNPHYIRYSYKVKEA